MSEGVFPCPVCRRLGVRWIAPRPDFAENGWRLKGQMVCRGCGSNWRSPAEYVDALPANSATRAYFSDALAEESWWEQMPVRT